MSMAQAGMPLKHKGMRCGSQLTRLGSSLSFLDGRSPAPWSGPLLVHGRVGLMPKVIHSFVSREEKVFHYVLLYFTSSGVRCVVTAAGEGPGLWSRCGTSTTTDDGWQVMGLPRREQGLVQRVGAQMDTLKIHHRLVGCRGRTWGLLAPTQ